MNQKKLTIIFALIILVTGLYLLLIPNRNIDLFSAMSINEESTVKEFATLNDHLLIIDKLDATEDDSSLFNNENNYIASATIDSLPLGVYMLNVHYFTDYDTPGYNSPSIRLAFTGGRENSYESEIISLANNQSFHKTPLYVTGLKGTTMVTKSKTNRDLQLNIEMLSNGITHIDSITLEDYTPWKIGIILMELIVYLLITIAMKFDIFSDNKKRLKLLAIVVLAAFTSLPAITGHYYNFEGHDYMNHVTRISTISSELMNGHFPALYQPECNYGYGYIMNIMYGSLFLYLPAILHVLGMPLAYAYNCYVIVINLATVLIGLYSFKRMFNSERYGFIATTLYSLATYRMCDLYVRSALGEYTGMIFLPLLAYGIYKVYLLKKPNLKDFAPLILGASGIIECHVLTMEMTCIFVGIFALINFKKTIKLIPQIIIAGIVVLLLNIGFIIPFLQMYTSGLAISSQIYSNDVYPTTATLGQIFSGFMTEAGTDYGFTTNNELPMTIGLSLIIGLLMYVILLVCKEKLHKFSLQCFALAIISLWLSTNLFPWELFGNNTDFFSKILTSFQFPWRFIEFATLFMTIVATYSIKIFNEKELLEKVFNTRFNLTLVVIFSGIIVLGAFFKDYMQVTKTTYIPSRTSDVYINDSLYLPTGIDYTTLYDNRPVVIDGEAIALSLGASEKDERTFSITSSTDSEVALPIINYSFLSAEDLATGEVLSSDDSSNFLQVKVPAGYAGQVIVKQHISLLWKLSLIISIVAWVGYVLISIKAAKRAI